VDFTVGTITRCAGNNHYTIPITVGQTTRDIKITASDLLTDFENLDEVREAIVNRLRSAKKEANASTFAQTRTALEGNTYKL
jgi:hypothetical protein